MHFKKLVRHYTALYAALKFARDQDELLQPSLELSDAMMEATVVEIKLGRTKDSAHTKRTFKFVVVADCTGKIAIGASVPKSGLESFRLSDETITEESRFYFQTKLSGTFEWMPKRDDPTQALISLWGKIHPKTTSASTTPLEMCLHLNHPTRSNQK